MTVSIIIAVKTWQKNLERCVSKCLNLDYPDYEVLILIDSCQDTESWVVGGNYLRPGVNKLGSDIAAGPGEVLIKIVATGPVYPAAKRDIALKHARGQVLAFIDDDAYPRSDWLKNAVADFADSSVAAVGGPAVTPPEDSFLEKASGAVYASPLVSGCCRCRYSICSKRQVDDYPSSNFLILGSVLKELGGFNTKFWPGEDTKLCRDIAVKLKKKIIYEPQALVFHHRRGLFLPHLRQVAGYALHRGYFVKLYPETSRRTVYFIPSLFVVSVAAGAVLSFVALPIRQAYFLGMITYAAVAAVFSLKNGPRLAGLVFAGIVFTHVFYGIYFLKGLLAKRLPEEI